VLAGREYGGGRGRGRRRRTADEKSTAVRREREGDVFEAGAAVLEFVAEGFDLDGGVFFFGGHGWEVFYVFSCGLRSAF